jgi:hypothetical protein
MTFSTAESALTEWMAVNATVAWVETSQPRVVETYVLESFCLPLNLESNAKTPFCPELRRIRDDAKRRARQLAILTT